MFDPPAHAGGTDSILEGESNFLISPAIPVIAIKTQEFLKGVSG
jgi:hypothetical protein